MNTPEPNISAQLHAARGICSNMAPPDPNRCLRCSGRVFVKGKCEGCGFPKQERGK